MAGQIGAGVQLDAIYHEDAIYTFNFSGTITTDDIGKAVTIDSAAANTVKLAGDNDEITGRLVSVENRTVEGTKICGVAKDGAFSFLRNPDAVSSPTNEVPAVGDYICGATTNGALKGYVQKIGSTGLKRWQVVELKTVNSLPYVVAVKL